MCFLYLHSKEPLEPGALLQGQGNLTAMEQLQHHPVHSVPLPQALVVSMGCWTRDTAPLQESLSCPCAEDTLWDVLSSCSCGKTALKEEKGPIPTRPEVPSPHPAAIQSAQVSSSHPQQSTN